MFFHTGEDENDGICLLLELHWNEFEHADREHAFFHARRLAPYFLLDEMPWCSTSTVVTVEFINMYPEKNPLKTAHLLANKRSTALNDLFCVRRRKILRRHVPLSGPSTLAILNIIPSIFSSTTRTNLSYSRAHPKHMMPVCLPN